VCVYEPKCSYRYYHIGEVFLSVERESGRRYFGPNILTKVSR
jgi:hypothetical protein